MNPPIVIDIALICQTVTGIISIGGIIGIIFVSKSTIAATQKDLHNHKEKSWEKITKIEDRLGTIEKNCLGHPHITNEQVDEKIEKAIKTTQVLLCNEIKHVKEDVGKLSDDIQEIKHLCGGSEHWRTMYQEGFAKLLKSIDPVLSAKFLEGE